MGAEGYRVFPDLSFATAIPYGGASAMIESMPRQAEKKAGKQGTGAAVLADLLRRVAAGEKAVLRRRYDLTAPRLFGVALRITGERHLAADALHDALLLILREAGRFDPAHGAAEAWRVSLLRDRALDIARRRRRGVLGYEPADRPSSEPGPLKRLDELEEGRALRTCLEALDEAPRRLIVLAFVDGLSHSDLASRLNPPLGTVKSAIRRGLRKLKECLGR
ncbi:MAG: sigma-70 family RNA polymerase sigma factor [Acetobacteraceae bacterium]